MKNVGEQIDYLVLLFVVHFLFLSTLLIQMTFFPQVKVQLSVLLLLGFYGFRSVFCFLQIKSKEMKQKSPWRVRHFQLALLENLLYIISMSLLLIYLYKAEQHHSLALAIIVPSALACLITVFCPLIDNTPCNQTMLLLSKSMCALRFFSGLCIFARYDRGSSWDWSVTFWPYWCSFAVQVILAIASIIILANTISNYLRDEAIVEDSKWNIPF